jgi:RNA polymerase sigma-70 factor (ECF subfamily)
MNHEHETLKTRWTLVERLKNPSDSTGWAEFDSLYRPLIFGVARKAGLGEEEAKDVVQETMGAMSRHIQDFVTHSDRGSFRAWLLQMARWRIQDQFRRRLPTVPTAGAPTRGSATTATMERVADANQPDLSAVCDEQWAAWIRDLALKELQMEVKADHYQIFHLAVLEEKPVEEVARIIGRSRAHIYLVKHRVGKALMRIAQRLEKRLS